MQRLDSQGDEKNANSISNAFSDDILIRNENIISKEHKTKSRHFSYLACRLSYKSLCWVDNLIIEVMAPLIPYKMIIVYLTTLPTLRAYNSLYMQDYFRQFFLFSFLIKMSMVKANGTVFYKRNCIMAKAKETVFFRSLGNPKGHTFDYFFCA